MKNKVILIVLCCVSLILSLLCLIEAAQISEQDHYYQITTNICIKDISKNDLIAYTEFDDGLDGLTFEGKYQKDKALVTIKLDYEDYEQLYEVDIWAIATVNKSNKYYKHVELISTIYTSTY